jgi:hypothetical protein
VIALPPFEAGAVHETLACDVPPVAVTLVGAPGTVAGVTALDGADAGPAPAAFAATTVNVYVVPLVSPVTVAEVTDPATVDDAPPGAAVTVYDVIALPPSVEGGVHDTMACVLPPVAVTPVGALGTLPGITALDGADAAPAPTLFVATTLNVYDVPFVNPVTVAEVTDPATVDDAPPGAAVTV